MSRRLFGATFVLSILAGCAAPNPRIKTKLNDAAMLVGSIPVDPLRWNAITSRVNRHDATFSILFGNDAAVRHSRTNASHDYPTGSVIAFVTWHQQEDIRWFGGQIPAAAKSVEFVSVESGEQGRPSVAYEVYEGSPLKKTSLADDRANSRVAFLLSQRAAGMP